MVLYVQNRSLVTHQMFMVRLDQYRYCTCDDHVYVCTTIGPVIGAVLFLLLLVAIAVFVAGYLYYRKKTKGRRITSIINADVSLS